MRRFPPPPGSSFPAAPSTPQAGSGSRSKEAPMQYEWTTPRTFPAGSSFVTPSASSSRIEDDRMNVSGGTSATFDEDGERARKRTHYEAMDVDTPPQVSTTRIPLGATLPFRPTPLSSHSNLLPGSSIDRAPLDFDADLFEPKKAFGLAEGDEVDMISDERELSLVLDDVGVRNRHTNGGNRRRGGAGISSRKERKAREEEEDDHSEEDSVKHGMGMGLGFAGNRMGSGGSNSEFSFQVHQHFGAGGMTGLDGAHVPPQPGRWLNRNTPYVLLGYLQFTSLALLSFLFLFITAFFLHTLYTDITLRLTSLTYEIRSEILQCAKAYVDNRCEPATRIPAMERKCSGWEECMGRDVVVVGKTRVVAETLAEVVNGFVEVISFKTMLFVILTLGLTIYGSSVALRKPQAPAYPFSSPHLGPAHFQNLGYQNYPPQMNPGYQTLQTPAGYGEQWEQNGKGSGQSVRAGDPGVSLEGKTKAKGWFS